MIHVVLTGYNCPEWMRRCLTSISLQDLDEFKVTALDDGSTDLRQPELMERWCYINGANWTFLRNEENMKAPFSFWRAIRETVKDPEDVVFLVDGDDFLCHESVLSRIDRAYRDPYVWLTYGQYMPYPHSTGQVLASDHTQQECDNRDFRGISGRYNHPITFKYFLHQQLTEADFQDDRGNWFQAGFDACLMWPMLELAVGDIGERPHFLFINDVLYSYNSVNPVSDAVVHVDQVEYSRTVKLRPKRERLIYNREF